MLQKITLFFSALLLFSCTEPDQVALDEYYDLNSFWESQIDQLQESDFNFNKVADMDGEQNELTDFKPDWKRELELFVSADLNKSAYRGAYQEVKSENTIQYKLKDGFDHPVKDLVIHLRDGQPVSMKAEMITENFLYNSDRNMEASFEAGVLKNYHIHGNQSLFIGSEKEFDIKVERE